MGIHRVTMMLVMTQSPSFLGLQILGLQMYCINTPRQQVGMDNVLKDVQKCIAPTNNICESHQFSILDVDLECPVQLLYQRRGFLEQTILFCHN